MTSVLLALCIFLPLICAPIAYIICKRSYSAANIFLCSVTALILLCTLELAFIGNRSDLLINNFCLSSLSFSFRGFQAVLAVLCALGFMVSAFATRFYFEKAEQNPRYFMFTLLTMSGTMGVFLSGDLFTTYIFFEIMSLSSWVWVAQTETALASKVSRSYLAYSIIGGLSLLMGLVLVNFSLNGVLSFDKIAEAAQLTSNPKMLFLGGIFLFIGFGIKAGAVLLHTWLPDSYCTAPAPATALLSGILSKAGIFGLIISATQLFYKNTSYALLLMASGTVTMLLGAFIALFTDNLKKTLAGSSLSQIGFILVGLSVLTLGLDTAYAASGVLLHITNHTLIKLVLFISCGIFYKNYNTTNLNKLQGTGRKNPILAACFIIPAAAISGIPLFGGYISKTLIHEAIVENMHIASASIHSILSVVEILFIIAGGFTLAYMTKLIYKLFIQKTISSQTKPIRFSKGTAVAMAIPTLILLLFGLFPSRTYDRIGNLCASSLMGEPFHAHYFAFENLKGALYSIAIGAVLFALTRLIFMNKKGEIKTWKFISLEKHIYTPLLNALSFVGALIARVMYSIIDFLIHIASLVVFFRDPERIPTDTDDHFGRYTKKYVRTGRISQTLAFELMLFGIGIAIILLYLLFR